MTGYEFRDRAAALFPGQSVCAAVDLWRFRHPDGTEQDKTTYKVYVAGDEVGRHFEGATSEAALAAAGEVRPQPVTRGDIQLGPEPRGWPDLAEPEARTAREGRPA